GALQDLGLPTSGLALSLAGFNVGVELGQLAIVGAFLPLAFALRGTLAYRRVLLGAGSAAIAAIASVWLVERAFDLPLFAMLAAACRNGSSRPTRRRRARRTCWCSAGAATFRGASGAMST